jgi:hypothetical protein
MRRAPKAAAVLVSVIACAVLPNTTAAQAVSGSPTLRFLDARDAPGAALAISRAITNDASLPRSATWDTISAADPDNLRVELVDPASTTLSASVTLESVEPRTGAVRARLAGIALTRPTASVAFRSTFLRLVGDAIDAEAPGVSDRVLRVALGDEVRARYVGAEGRAASVAARVGSSSALDRGGAIYRGRLRIRVLRRTVDGAPVVGTSDASALAIARRQVEITNEIWGQCGITFGDPGAADVSVVDPPVSALLAVADVDGLPAAGGGTIRFTVGGRAIQPLATRAGERPIGTALRIAEAVRALGFVAQAFENPPTELATGRSADVVVRARDGAPVAIDRDGTAPLSSDARQSLTLGRVDLADGLQEFENMTAVVGTLEERTLIRLLADDDPRTVDIFVVGRFTGNGRQGEAFIEGDGGSIANALVLDRNGMQQEREAWTQAHELGHVLLDHPFHPDNVGPDRPWMLMDADSSLGLVTGPKRLTDDECLRALVESGPGAQPELLSREPAE